MNFYKPENKRYQIAFEMTQKEHGLLTEMLKNFNKQIELSGNMYYNKDYLKTLKNICERKCEDLEERDV